MVRKENGRYREATKSEIFEAARVKLEHIFSRESELLESPDGVKDWLRIRLPIKAMKCLACFGWIIVTVPLPSMKSHMELSIVRR